MRKKVSEYIENPTPKLAKELTTMELRFADRHKKPAPKPNEPPKNTNQGAEGKGPPAPAKVAPVAPKK
jgi:hypothetical protein